MGADIREGTCPLCAHDQIIESQPIDYVHGDMNFPEAVTYETGWFNERMKPNKPHGILQRYVCQKCGYCQTFARDPGTIPIGAEYNTRMLPGKPPS